MKTSTACLHSLWSSGIANPEKALTVVGASGITKEDFDSIEEKSIFLGIAEILGRGDVPDVGSFGRWASVVPQEAVAAVAVGGDAGMLSQRLRALKIENQRRAVLLELQAAVATAKLPESDLNEISKSISNANNAFLGIAQGSGYTKGDAILDGLLDRLQRVQTGEIPGVLPTGIESWDVALLGFQPTLTVVGALEGVGKSCLVAGWARQMMIQKIKVGVLSLEDEAQWLMRRLVAHKAQVPVALIGRKRLFDGPMERVGSAVEAIAPYAQYLHVLNKQHAPLSEVVGAANRMVSEGCKVILVDHIGEILMARSERHDLDVTNALSQLRNIANTTGVPVVVFSHLRRREGLTRDKEPTISDFANSTGLARQARVAIGLWRDNGTLTATVLKHTDGESNVSFSLNVATTAGIVIETPASPDALREQAYQQST